MKSTGGKLHLQRALIGLTGIFIISCTQAEVTSLNVSPSENEVEVEIVLPAGDSHIGGENPVHPSTMTAVHNQWRSQVGLPGLRWSEKLADVAQTWANSLKDDSCGFYHSGNGYGENLYKATPIMWSDGRRELQDKSPKEVIDSWGNEIEDYSYSDNSCSGVCGHYTQVVWKETTEVGCAMSVCNDKSQIWVCSYYPAGNVVGKRPY